MLLAWLSSTAPVHWGFEPLRAWTTRMPGRTRCAEPDAFCASASLFKLTYVGIEPELRKNEPEETPLHLQDMETRGGTGGIEGTWEGGNLPPPPPPPGGGGGFSFPR